MSMLSAPARSKASFPAPSALSTPSAVSANSNCSSCACLLASEALPLHQRHHTNAHRQQFGQPVEDEGTVGRKGEGSDEDELGEMGGDHHRVELGHRIGRRRHQHTDSSATSFCARFAFPSRRNSLFVSSIRLSLLSRWPLAAHRYESGNRETCEPVSDRETA